MTVTAPQGASAPEGDVAGTVDRLRATFATGRTRPHSWRDAQLQSLDRLLVDHEDEFVDALVTDLRRTRFDAALLDVWSTRPEVRHARKHLQRWMRPRSVKAPLNTRPGKAWYQYEPLGVVLVIGPWNYPLHLTLAPLVGALAAGNCVVVKPSEITCASSSALARLLPRYLDPDAVAVVEGAAETTLGLLNQGFDHCFFTGSSSVGAAVMAAAAPHLTPVTLELGGKCPVIVTESARLDVAARRVAFGKLINGGQTCVAPDYVLVARRVREQFTDLLTGALRAFTEGREVPIVNQRHADRIAQLLRTAGGTTVLGGAVDVETAMAQPTVVVDPEPKAPILHEEIFGPVLPLVTVDSVDEAVAHIRRSGRPLASYVFTESRSDEQKVLDGVASGGTVVNHVMLQLAVNDLPFGGVGASGMGRYHGRWGFETFSHPRAVLRKPTSFDLRFTYPPYGARMQRVMRRMM